MADVLIAILKSAFLIFAFLFGLVGVPLFYLSLILGAVRARIPTGCRNLRQKMGTE